LESGMLIPTTLIIYAVFIIRSKDGGHAALAVLNFMLPQIMARIFVRFDGQILIAASDVGLRPVVDHGSSKFGTHRGA
ncbi:hypothetical protein V5O48_010285, partial [Marasmius crinis-equi]